MEFFLDCRHFWSLAFLTELWKQVSSKLSQEPYQSTSELLFQCFFPAATFACHLIKKSSHIAGGLLQIQLLLTNFHWKHLLGIKMIQHNLSEKHSLNSKYMQKYLEMPWAFNASVNHINLNFRLNKNFLTEKPFIASDHSYKSSKMPCILDRLMLRETFWLD